LWLSRRRKGERVCEMRLRTHVRDGLRGSSCDARKILSSKDVGFTNIRDDKRSELDTLNFNSVIRALVEPHGDIMRRAAQLAESDYEEVQMEGHIARLESDVSHIQKDVAEIKVNLKGLDGKVDGYRDRMDSRMDGLRDKMDDMRNKMEVGFTDIRQSIAQLTVMMEKNYGKSKVTSIGTRVWALSTLGGVLLVMARVFKWI